MAVPNSFHVGKMLTYDQYQPKDNKYGSLGACPDNKVSNKISGIKSESKSVLMKISGDC